MPDDCYLCELPFKLRNRYDFIVDGDEDRDANKLCFKCSQLTSLRKCHNCHTLTDSLHWPIYTTMYRTCYACCVENLYWCGSCAQWTGEMADEYSCPACYECDCGDYDCERCYPDGSPTNDFIHDYSYQPDLEFHSSITECNFYPDEHTLYLGMELEIGFKSYNIGEAAELLTDRSHGVVYCKEDSSIEPGGFEMVTHPMTLEAAKDLIPFDTLRELRTNYEASAYRNGIHVHASRAGFDNDSHIYRWMKLIYRNKSFVEGIARRESEEWASFDNGLRENQKYLSEKRRGSKTRHHPIYTTRYSAINVENNDTFEVRVFRGSLLREEILAALELVHASIEYTRYLTSNDILNHDGWKWYKFIEWTDLHAPTYENLIAQNIKLNATTLQDGSANTTPTARAVRTELEQMEYHLTFDPA